MDIFIECLAMFSEYCMLKYLCFVCCPETLDPKKCLTFNVVFFGAIKSIFFNDSSFQPK